MFWFYFYDIEVNVIKYCFFVDYYISKDIREDVFIVWRIFINFLESILIKCINVFKICTLFNFFFGDYFKEIIRWKIKIFL